VYKPSVKKENAGVGRVINVDLVAHSLANRKIKRTLTPIVSQGFLEGEQDQKQQSNNNNNNNNTKNKNKDKNKCKSSINKYGEAESSKSSASSSENLSNQSIRSSQSTDMTSLDEEFKISGNNTINIDKVEQTNKFHSSGNGKEKNLRRGKTIQCTTTAMFQEFQFDQSNELTASCFINHFLLLRWIWINNNNIKREM
jgi:hypothetical protein